MRSYTEREADILATGLLDVLIEIGQPTDHIAIIKKLYLETSWYGVGIQTAYRYVTELMSDGTLKDVGNGKYTI